MRSGAPAGPIGDGQDRMGVDVCGDRRRRVVASTVWVIDPAIDRADIPVLCARLADLLRPCGREDAVVVCDVAGITEPSAVTVEALARLRLTARRFGADIRVRGAHVRLRQLLAFAGLGEVIPIDGGSALEPHRQAEQREQPLRVEEVGDPADPAG
jgi:STAS domain